MSKAPGYQQHPDHKVRETRLSNPVRVEIGGEVVAESQDVVRVDEDGYPPRYYFPRGDVKMDRLARSDTTSVCPFKGMAHYYAVRVGDRLLKDAVWTYEAPYDEHPGLKERLAFWEGRFPEIAIRQG
jgi:uncharacterized protein (DUF427 family)